MLCAVLACTVAAAAAASKPHLIFVLADDFGYYDVSFRNPAAHTPHIDGLVAEGLQLRRFYTYKFCSPTRSSLLSGRLPIHVNTENNPTSKPGGVDLRMTLLSEKLRAQGYFTGVSGKWVRVCPMALAVFESPTTSILTTTYCYRAHVLPLPCSPSLRR